MPTCLLAWSSCPSITPFDEACSAASEGIRCTCKIFLPWIQIHHFGSVAVFHNRLAVHHFCTPLLTLNDTATGRQRAHTLHWEGGEEEKKKKQAQPLLLASQIRGTGRQYATVRSAVQSMLINWEIAGGQGRCPSSSVRRALLCRPSAAMNLAFLPRSHGSPAEDARPLFTRPAVQHARPSELTAARKGGGGGLRFRFSHANVRERRAVCMHASIWYGDDHQSGAYMHW
jgi:hypothetical protein